MRISELVKFSWRMVKAPFSCVKNLTIFPDFFFIYHKSTFRPLSVAILRIRSRLFSKKKFRGSFM